MYIYKITESTARRNLQNLIDKIVFTQKGAVRTTSFDLNLE